MIESKVEKNKTTNIDTSTSLNQTRSSRNSKLYKQVYGNYDEFDNLPLEDNTNEIDMAKLRELVLSNNSKKEEKEIEKNLNILEQRKRQIDEQKLYDINKILEKAKYENKKLKTPATKKPKTDLLMTLKSTELSLDEINEARARYQEKFVKEQEDKLKKEQELELKEETEVKEELLSMTRELKYKNLSETITDENKKENSSTEINNTNSLSFDLFEDLKPTGNTITTKPITSDLINRTNTSQIKSDIYSGDTSDIDIIKDMPYKKEKESDFFTNAYEFSEKDFADNDDEEFFDTPKRGGLFKILLLVLAIFIFVGVIIYFIGTYGLGLS